MNVEIGKVQPTGDKKVDDFNNFILDVFNLGSGNILQSGSTLSWNVWFTPPELVNQTEWRNHAKKWRESLDVTHNYPSDIVGLTNKWGESQYFDGSKFNVLPQAIHTEAKALHNFLQNYTCEVEDDVTNSVKSIAKGIIDKFKHLY